MKSIIFVHGTGVREKSYADSLAQIRASLKPENLPVTPCYWGKYGAEMKKGGISIPDFDATRSIDQLSEEDKEIAGWAALYQDPLYEFRLLQSKAVQRQERSGFVPNRVSAFQQLDPILRRLQTVSQLEAQLRKCRLTEVWDEALGAVTQSPEYGQAMQRESDVTSEIRYSVARAITAQALQLYHRKYDDGADWISGEDRDLLVELLVAEFGGVDRSLKAWLLKTLFARPFSRYVRRRRGRFSAMSFETIGDILLYQARGDAIRNFIRQRIEEADPPVALLTHSLGGIACVDLLVEHDLSKKVGLLITVGSQAPVLYEMDALVGLPFGQSLPGHFPKRWLNIYDPRDFLSYLARGVFHGPEIEDVRVNNRQPFPQAHNSYWDNKQVWDAIKKEIF